MRRLLIPALLLLIAIPASAGRWGGGMSINIDDDDWRDVPDCGDIRVTMDDERIPMRSQEIPVSARGTLRVRTDRNGGVYVRGWEGSNYSVLACTAAGPSVNPADIRIANTADGLTATGPDEGRWVAYFIVRAPRGASLDLESNNGPISVAGFNGDLKARVQNGPISLKESSGKINARAQNGPITIAGGSGDITAEAQNGPVSVKLDGMSWNGNLDASTKNGPVSLKLPRGFRSGVVVEQLGRGPISCRAEECKQISMYDADDDDDGRVRKLQFGSGPQVVKLSTVNGPVSVKDRD
jgi:hypothetical protein